MIITKILFFPFWVIKIILGLIACFCVYLVGLFAVMVAGATFEDVDEKIRGILNWALKYGA